MKNYTMTKLGLIGTVGVPARYGGFETLAEYLIPQSTHRFDMTIYCSGKTYKKEERMETYNGAKLKYIPLEANGMQSILYDLWSMLHAVRTQDVLLVLGVSACIFLPIIKLFTKKKVIVNIDGLEWRRPKWNWFAKRFLLLSEKVACRYADEIITDNRMLQEYVNIRYGIKGNLIEYGADHVQSEKLNIDDLKQYEFLGTEYAFKVARIEPENNIHLILQAFSELPYMPLVIVGNWNNSLYGKRLREEYGETQNIYLLDPIYDSRSINVLRSNATIYIHGHSAGGTNPSLVEAMYLGLPILSYDVIYNRVTTNNLALFFSDVEELKRELVTLSERPLDKIGKSLQEYAYKRYTWAIVAQKYGDLALGIKSEASIFPKRKEGRFTLMPEASARVSA
jgi:glycosyltransferase involved in cell wall biosynthesis